MATVTICKCDRCGVTLDVAPPSNGHPWARVSVSEPSGLVTVGEWFDLCLNCEQLLREGIAKLVAAPKKRGRPAAKKTRAPRTKRVKETTAETK